MARRLSMSLFSRLARRFDIARLPLFNRLVRRVDTADLSLPVLRRLTLRLYRYASGLFRLTRRQS